jgi:YD repeat-containing protein
MFSAASPQHHMSSSPKSGAAASAALASESLMKDIVSNAFNMKSQLSGAVNPQTGSVGFSEPGAVVPGPHGLNVNLGISYSQSDSANYFHLGNGWRFNLPYLEMLGQAPARLHLANGQAYKLTAQSGGKYALKYYSLKNIEFLKQPGSFKVTYIDPQTNKPVNYTVNYNYSLKVLVPGVTIYYFNNYGNLVGIGNRFHYNYVAFKYANEFNHTFAEIISGYGQLIKFAYTVDQVTVTLPDNRVFSYSIKDNNGSRTCGTPELSVITVPGSTTTPIQDRQTTINYECDALSHMTLPTDVTYPSGAHTIFSYNASLRLQNGSLPAVSSLKIEDQNNKLLEPVTYYFYGNPGTSNYHNFSGFPNIGVVGKDNLLEATPNDTYQYSTAITQGGKKTIMTFNHLHLQVAEKICVSTNPASNYADSFICPNQQPVQTSTFLYSGQNANGQYDSAKVQNYSELTKTLPNYQKARQTSQTYFRLSSLGASQVTDLPKSRTETHSFAYNDYGQLVSETLPNGTVTKTLYDTSLGNFDALPLCKEVIVSSPAKPGVDQAAYLTKYNLGPDKEGVRVINSQVKYYEGGVSTAALQSAADPCSALTAPASDKKSVK